jgi:tetratricopeptide (TPR) repeat protein
MPPVSFTLITKNAPEGALKAIESCAPVFREGDEWVVLDNSAEPSPALKERVDQYIHRPDLTEDFTPYVERWLPESLWPRFHEHYKDPFGILDFAGAREITRQAAKHPVIFWLDSDDVLKGEDLPALRDKVDELMALEGARVDSIFLNYEYTFDSDGSVTTLLRRERFFFRDRHVWKGRCHETAIPTADPALPVGFIEDGDARIVHTDARKPPGVSDFRNYVILRKELEVVEGAIDPRTLFYLGNAARGLRLFKESKDYYQRFDRVSGSKDDRYAALYYQASMNLDPEVRRPLEALDLYYRCVDLDPGDPRGYYGVSRCYTLLERHFEAIQWYQLGYPKKLPATQVFSHDPTQISYHPHVLAAYSAKELNNSTLACELANRAIAARPGHEDSKALAADLKSIWGAHKMRDSLAFLLQQFSHGGPNAKRVARELCAEFNYVPPEIEEMGLNRREDPDPREPRPALAIFCGETPEEWGPDNRETGIGGSEKMVILVAEALQSRGHWNVTVYAKVPHPRRGVDKETGVRWCHWSEFDEKVPRDVFVAWRSARAVAMEGRFRKRVIWNHDIQDPRTYDDRVLALVDEVQFQSEYHAAPVRDKLDAESVWVANNAIEWALQGNAPKNPKQVVYCSSPDRGLHTALRVMRRAKELDPDLVFVIAYGFTPFTRKSFARLPHRWIPDWGHETHVGLYEREVNKLIDEVGARMLHRIGFRQCASLLLGSGVWLYPTRFAEISCMAAMEAQAAGCVPVSTRHAALSETLLPYAQTLAAPLPELPRQGEATEEWIELAAQAVVEAAKVSADDPRRVELAKQAWERFSIDRLAEEWERRLAA